MNKGHEMSAWTFKALIALLIVRPHVSSVTSTSLVSASVSKDENVGVDGLAVAVAMLGFELEPSCSGGKVVVVGVVKGGVASAEIDTPFGNRSQGSASMVRIVRSTCVSY